MEKLFNRTKEQVEEEIYLIEELKKIEVRKKEREKKQQEVSKLLTAAGDLENSKITNNNLKVKQIENKTVNALPKPSKLKQRKNSVNSNDGSISVVIGNRPSKSSQSEGLISPSSVTSSVPESKSSKKPIVFKPISESTGIKFPDTKVSGVSLRSSRTKLPQSVGLKKIKAIEQLLDELQIEHKPIATETVCDNFNDLRSDIVLLYELQQAL
ncbi:DNA methyltransferase 1-associated 1, partial [Brachionus plicatilis]